MTEKYIENVIEVIAKKTGLLLSPAQAKQLVSRIDHLSVKDEIEEGSCYDTYPREVLVDTLCEKITGRAAWTYGEMAENPGGYEVWLERFIEDAAIQGYKFRRDENE